MIVDTHCHLHFDAFNEDREEVIRRAREAGVKYMVNVGTDLETNQAAHDLAQQHDFIFCTAGLHPHSSHEATEADLKAIENFVIEKKPKAIGEIGIDYFKSEAAPDVQKKVFTAMLHIALKNGLPVIVHSRNAFQDTLDILKAEGQGKIKGVMHCYSYDEACLRQLLDIGFLASFTCNLTFRSATSLLEVAKFIPLDRMMLETDSPYLAPQACRGTRNEPSNLKHLVEFLSEKRGISRAELEEATSRTAINFFKLEAQAKP